MEALGTVDRLSRWMGLLPGRKVWLVVHLACYSALLACLLGEDKALSVGFNPLEVILKVYEVSFVPHLLVTNWVALANPGYLPPVSLFTHASPPSSFFFSSIALLIFLFHLPWFYDHLLRRRFPNVIMILVQYSYFQLIPYQFCTFLLLISSRLKSLSLLPLSPSNLLPTLHLHSSLVRASRSVTRFYSNQILIIAASEFVKFVYYTYQLITLAGESPPRPLKILEHVLLMIVCASPVLLMFAVCDYTKSQDEEFQKALVVWASGKTTPDEAELYLHTMGNQKLEFSAKGFFKMETQGLIKVLGLVTTLVMVLYQYDFGLTVPI